ncbi:hypothetical protein L1987_44547 [Smallanthus sonchifolius]|uniref:Uncharacterized protein n=1 Tax=Smallanthus sonchifolius TaxID=185202 RepID=A0ACB9GPL0_9ASTR|nr:hypothetical protein L1987_44547 [Smallanthus sonchifolius]
METLHQIFMTVIAAFAFLILIARIASAATNHPHSRSIREDEFKSSKTEKSSSKRKSTKKVRFAVDHDEFVVNKTVAGPSETKSIVLENDHSEIEEAVDRDCGNETADYHDRSVNDESVSNFVDYDRTKEGKSVLVEGTVIGEENVANCDENQMCVKLLCDDGIDEAEKEKVGLISEEDDSSDDDWEGVERSDLEKVFAMAADYGKLDDSLQSLESDIQMQLYALHKVATEGPCHEAQPMALKVSARAKWNSWQKLGNMDPDVAMEEYIALISKLVPGWSQGIHSVDKR